MKKIFTSDEHLWLYSMGRKRRRQRLTWRRMTSKP